LNKEKHRLNIKFCNNSGKRNKAPKIATIIDTNLAISDKGLLLILLVIEKYAIKPRITISMIKIIY
tara:strand:+ start:311 stop:508 length:198 start_codon:yes stop_codon:yes gene_type:complete